VTFVVAAILFLCCTKICRSGHKDRQNDESPLLSLSLTDSGGTVLISRSVIFSVLNYFSSTFL
jgi:hypothetical protein